MWECKGYPLARVTLAPGLPFLLVNRAYDMNINYGELCVFSKEGWQRPLFQIPCPEQVEITLNNM